LARQRDRIPIRVEIKDAEASSGYFISRLAQELNTLAENESSLTSVRQYYAKMPTPTARLIHDRELTERLLQLPGGRYLRPLELAASRRLSATIPGLERQILYPQEDQGYISLVDYIQHNIETTRLIVNIENIQSLDTLSKDLLLEVVKTAQDGFFLFEYTEKTEPRYSVRDLGEMFSGVADRSTIYPLNWLPLGELLRQETAVNIKALLERAYYESQGNLKALQDLEVLILDRERFSKLDAELRQADFASQSPTKILVKTLRKPDLFLLCAVVSHRSSVSKDLLRVLYEYSEHFKEVYYDVDLSVERLLNLGLLTEVRGIVSVNHDFIAAEIRSDGRFDRFVEIASFAWAAYYRSLLEAGDYSSNSRAEVLAQLFYFYNRTDIRRLRSLLPEVKSLVLGSKYPRDITKYVKKLRDSLWDEGPLESEVNEVSLFLLDLYYEAGLFDDAYALLDDIKAHPQYLFILKIAILDRLDRHREASSLIENELRKHNLDEGTAVHLSLLLILLISKRSLNDYSACREIFDQIEKRRDFAKLPEYGYHLRNAEIVLSTTESIPYLEKSVLHFRDFGDNLNEAHSRITLAMYMTCLGDTDGAESQLGLAESLLAHKFMERHIILNNRAVNAIYADIEQASEHLDLLRFALRTAATTFDKIIVSNNIFVCATLRGRYDYADDVFDSLEQLLSEQPDQAVHRTVYYNRSFFYKTIGDVRHAETFLEQARRALPRHSPYWRFKLYGEWSADCLAEKLLLEHDFQLSFITYWHFRIRRDLVLSE